MKRLVNWAVNWRGAGFKCARADIRELWRQFRGEPNRPVAAPSRLLQHFFAHGPMSGWMRSMPQAVGRRGYLSLFVSAKATSHARAEQGHWWNWQWSGKC